MNRYAFFSANFFQPPQVATLALRAEQPICPPDTSARRYVTPPPMSLHDRARSTCSSPASMPLDFWSS